MFLSAAHARPSVHAPSAVPDPFLENLNLIQLSVRLCRDQKKKRNQGIWVAEREADDLGFKPRVKTQLWDHADQNTLLLIKRTLIGRIQYCEGFLLKAVVLIPKELDASSIIQMQMQISAIMKSFEKNI
jgi:hypothetical protein